MAKTQKVSIRLVKGFGSDFGATHHRRGPVYLTTGPDYQEFELTDKELEAVRNDASFEIKDADSEEPKTEDTAPRRTRTRRSKDADSEEPKTEDTAPRRTRTRRSKDADSEEPKTEDTAPRRTRTRRSKDADSDSDAETPEQKKAREDDEELARLQAEEDAAKANNTVERNGRNYQADGATTQDVSEE